MLSDKAQTLQNVLTFFDPNLILERLILESKAQFSEDKLTFLFSEAGYVVWTILVSDTLLTLV